MAKSSQKRILIINTPGLRNRGGMAAVMGALSSLRRELPEARITVLYHHGEDREELGRICTRYGATMRWHPWFREHPLRAVIVLLSAVPALVSLIQTLFGFGVYRDADVILGLDIDTLHDNYGIFFPLWTLYNTLLGVLAGKPVVVWGAGIGRFGRGWLRRLARLVLNRVRLIAAREESSRDYAVSLGITRPRIEATADHAFLLEPAPPGRIDEIFKAEGIAVGDSPLVAFAPSQFIHHFAFTDMHNLTERYRYHAAALVEVVEYIVEACGADVLLVCHTITETEDDRIIAGNIRRGVRNPDRVKLVGDYAADELKGVIGRCDLAVGERMHAVIAATSLAVPTVAVVYGEKAHGIVGDMMGLHDYLVEIDRYDPRGLAAAMKEKIGLAWERREDIRADLQKRAAAAREKAGRNASLVRELLEEA